MDDVLECLNYTRVRDAHGDLSNCSFHENYPNITTGFLSSPEIGQSFAVDISSITLV